MAECVFVVVAADYGDVHVVGVFPSRESAKADPAVKDWQKDGYRIDVTPCVIGKAEWRCGFDA